MRSLPQRIKNRILITAGRLRYELFNKTISEHAVRSRLNPALRRSLPSGLDFWPALYQEFVKSCPAGIRSYDASLFRERERVIGGALAGGITALSRALEPPPGFDWNTDLFFNVQWERKYYKALADTKPGSDLVLLWMPNRMLHLLDLSRAFAVTNDERYAKEWIRQAVSWCRANPYCVGMNWRSPLEIGIRLYSFSLGLRELSGSTSLDSASLGILIRSMILQGEHLAAHFSYWEGNANNHLIGEAAALYAHASMWNLSERSGEWRARSRDVFEREIERQVLSDGVSFEQSLNYHAQVLDFALLYLLFRRQEDDPADARLTVRVESMARAYLTMLSPRGRLPRFGDDTAREFLILENSDTVEGRILDDPLVLESFIKPEFRAALSEASGSDAILKISVPLSIARVLPAAGFVSLRSRGSHLAYSAGIAREEQPHDGHLHSDLGTFELEIDGEMVFIDSGTWLYNYDRRSRDHFKSTRAHNTLLIDGRELMRSAGTFKWETVRKARGLQHVAAQGDDCIWSRHFVEGAADSRFMHARVVIQTGTGEWLIIDHLSPDRESGSAGEDHEHETEVLFHTPFEQLDALAPGNAVGFTLNIRESGAHDGPGRKTPGTSRWRFDGASSAHYRMRIVVDRDNPLAWYSPRYGDLCCGATIAAAVAFTGAASICHVLSAIDCAPPVIECGPADAMVRLLDHRVEWRFEFAPLRITRNGTVLSTAPAAGSSTDHETSSHE